MEDGQIKFSIENANCNFFLVPGIRPNIIVKIPGIFAFCLIQVHSLMCSYFLIMNGGSDL